MAASDRTSPRDRQPSAPSRNRAAREAMAEGLNEKPVTNPPTIKQAGLPDKVANPPKPKWQWYWCGARRFMNGVMYDPEANPDHQLIQVNIALYDKEALEGAHKLQPYNGEEFSPFLIGGQVAEDHPARPVPDGKGKPRVRTSPD